MDAPDLQQIRALLRDQPAVAESRTAAPLVGGLKRIFRRSPGGAARLGQDDPLVAQALVAPQRTLPAPTPSLFEVAELPLPEGPRRAAFGRAEPKPAAEPSVKPPSSPPVLDPAETIVVPRRARSDAGAIGADEVLELRELLAERLPGLLTPALLVSLDPPGPSGSAAAVIPAAPGPPALPTAAEAPGPSPDWGRRAICITSARAAQFGEQALLGELYAQLCSEHEKLRTRLDAAAHLFEADRTAA